jgi:enamine deaminase RidA (YjgF/YER057c/UK114 family)
LFQAGQVGDDTSHDVEGQTRQVLAKIGSVLKEAGSDKTKILKVNIWRADIGDFDTMITLGRVGREGLHSGSSQD